MACITQFSPDKIVLIREEDAPAKMKETERMLQETVGGFWKLKSNLPVYTTWLWWPGTLRK